MRGQHHHLLAALTRAGSGLGIRMNLAKLGSNGGIEVMDSNNRTSARTGYRSISWYGQFSKELCVIDWAGFGNVARSPARLLGRD